MTCEQCIAQLSRWIEGDLSEQQAAQVAAHVEGCPECAALAESLRALMNETAGLEASLPVPEAAAAGWRQAVREEAALRPKQKSAKAPRGSRGSFWRRGWGRLATVAAALVLVLGLYAALREGVNLNTYNTALQEDSLRRSLDQDAWVLEEAEYQAEAAPLAAMAPAAPMEGAVPAYDSDSGAGEAPVAQPGQNASLFKAAPAGTMLERRAWYTLTTQQFDADAQKLSDLPDALGGWVESLTTSGKSYDEGGGGRQLSMLLRIPADRMEEALEDLSAIGALEYSYITATDVSESYYDTQGRLQSALALQEQLQALLQKAEDVESLTLLTKELSDNQLQIDSLQGSLRGMESRVAYSRIDVSLNETHTPTLSDPASPSLGARLRNGLVESLNALRSFFAGLMVWIVRLLPWLILAGLVALGVVLLVRRRRK